MTEEASEILRLREANFALRRKNRQCEQEAKRQRLRAEAAERAARDQRLELDSLANRLRDQRR